jgi:hypothetical protein
MPEIRDKVYRRVADVQSGYKLFSEVLIPASALAVDTPYSTNDMTVDFTGYLRQAFKILPLNGGAGPTVEVEIQEFLPNPGAPNDGDPANGSWGTKAGLGIGIAAMDVIFEHHQEDVMRLTRLVLTPKTAVPVNGIKVEISGRRTSEMALRIEQTCDWCNVSSPVTLPRSGPLDLAAVKLPDGWEEKSPFPGGNVGPQDGQQLCGDCQKDYAVVLTQADEARDNVYRQAMSKAQARRRPVGPAAAGKSSSFGR